MGAEPPQEPLGGPYSAFGIDSSYEMDPVCEAERLSSHDVLRVRAENPGPLTLSGTNTWVVDRNPAFVVDPGPPLEGHLERLLAVIESRGGLGGIALTHDHPDHAGAVEALREHHPAPLAAGRGKVDLLLRDGATFGPFVAIPTPGHASDHFALIADRACFTGDAVLGEGSVFIVPEPDAMSSYLNSLARLCTLELDVLCPGHGPAIWEPENKLEEYIGHRYDREHRLIIALSEGRRSVEELLDAAWPEIAPELRPLAAITLAAHLDKLASEGALPAGVERPSFEPPVW
jgi:glyoxylase-like metal-dependent hydrolase (beta-lactamase superfamily II)